MKIFTFLISLFIATQLYATNPSYHFSDSDSIITTFTITGISGNIEVEQWNKDELSIIITQTKNIDKPYNFSKYLTIKKEGNKIEIKEKKSSDSFKFKLFFITLFSSNSYSDTTDYGLKWKIKIPYYINSCGIKTTSGNIKIVNTNINLDLDTSSGNILLKNNKGNFSIDTSSGNVSVENTKGNFDIDTSSGDVKMNNNSGSLNIDTSSGDVTINNAIANGYIDTSSGDVHGYNLVGKWQIATSSGTVYVQGKYNNYYIKLTTNSSGKIYVDNNQYNDSYIINNTVIDKYLKISTSSGNITVINDDK